MADTAQAFPLLPDGPTEAQPLDSFLPQADTPAVRVPKNVDEVAAQIALAQDSIHNAFADRVRHNTSAIKSGGTGPLLAQVLSSEFEDQRIGAQAQAVAFAKAQDAQGAEAAAREAQAIAKRGAETTPENDPHGAHQVAVGRALEGLTGLDYAQTLYRSLGVFDKRVAEAAGDVATRNILAREASTVDEGASMWDHIKLFGRSLVPFMDDTLLARAISKTIGTDITVDKYSAITQFRNYMLGLEPADRQVVVRKLIGELSTNKAVSADALRQVGELTKEEYNVGVGLNAFQATDVVAVFRALAMLGRKGIPLKAVKDVAGEKQAGELAAADLVTKGKLTGLNDEELVARVIAGGTSPLEADPAALRGLSPHAQEKLKTDWNELLTGIQDRLNSSSLSPDEVKAAAAEIRASWMSGTNKRVYSVEFGEASADGQKMSVYWQDKEGNAFLSQEAAQAFAKERGLVSYEVVPKNIDHATAHPSQFAPGDGPSESGGIGGIKFKMDEDVLPALQKHPMEKVDSFFDELKGNYAGDPMAEAIVDEFRTVAGHRMESTSADRLLSIVARQSADEDYRLLAETLLARKGVKWNQVPVTLEASISRNGAYAPAADRISLSLHNIADTETIIHEAVHAHNSQVVDIALKLKGVRDKLLTHEQIAASEELNTLWKRVKTKVDGEDLRLMEKQGSLYDGIVNAKKLFATENPAELIAYGMTNPEVRKYLQSLKLSQLGYTGDERSVWSKLWEVFKGVLGYRADDTALAKLVGIHEKFLDNIAEGERNVMGKLQREGTLSSRDVNDLVGAAYEAKPHVKLKLRPTVTGEWLVKESRHDPLSYNSVGKFSDKDIESMPWIAVDPKHAASEQGVEARVVGVHAEARTKAQLSEYITPYYKGLSKDQVQRVQSVLEEGDSFSNAGGKGREFTYSEVRGKGLNDDEALAYLATRQLRMAMYHIRNGEMVRHLRAQGLKEVELPTVSIKTAGKELSPEEVDALGKPIYDLSTRTTHDVAPGQRVVRLAQPVKIDGELRQLLGVDATTAKVRDIVTALHYRPGEFSRIYSDEYFITMKRAVKVDGVLTHMDETVRTARSVREAQDFTQRVSLAVNVLRNKGPVRELSRLVGDFFDVKDFKKAYRNGDFDGLKSLDYHYTRNKDEYLNGSVNEALANGRLFTSQRSERLMSVDRARENTLGVFESLEAEITNVSRVANIAQWRETMVRRWMNTFGDLLPNKTGNDVADFYAAAGAKFTKNTQDALFAERTHKYIMRQIGLRTSEERYYEQLTRRMTEKYFTGGEKIETVGAKIRQGKGVLGFIRNVNFNLTLGMFNPAQLLVQANGAATALMLSPLHGVAAAKTFPLLRMALMSDNPAVWRHFAKADIGGNSEDFVKLVKAVRQTGILDNLKSTSLYNAEDGKLNIFGAYPSKVMGSQTFFFNRGEEFSRVVSFDVARREFTAAHPELDWTSKEALGQIVVRMDDLTQNMTKANLARFQEGASSIPLQFAQYNIKLAANIMSGLLGKGEGRGFTKREAVQLLAGHILLYGAAGNGLVGLMDEVLPNSVKDSMPVAMKTYLAQGLITGLVAQVGEALTGERANIALGSRLGSFNYYQQLGEALFTDPKNVYAALMGPTVSTAKRLGVIGDVSYLWFKDPELSAKDVLEGVALMGSEQVSTLRNAAKAYLFHQHANMMIDKNGFAVAQLTPMEVLGQGLGFQPTAAVDVANLIKTKKDHEQAIGDIATVVYQVQKQIMSARLRGDNDYADEQHKLLQALWPTNTGDFMEVQRRIRDKMYPYDTHMQKLLGDYLFKGQTYDKPLVVTQPPRKE